MKGIQNTDNLMDSYSQMKDRYIGNGKGTNLPLIMYVARNN